MSRTEIFSKLTRSLRIARFCDRLKISTSEGLERVAEAETAHFMNRRHFLGTTGSLLALAATGCALDEPEGGLATRRAGIKVPLSDVAVVGAGLAGLACADDFERRARQAVTVFEASNRVGGRCYSLGAGFPGPVTFPGQTVERGGEFIDTTHTTMRNYARDFGFELEDVTKEPGDVFYYFDGQFFSEADVVDEYRDFVPAMRPDLQALTPPTADDFTPADEVLDFTNLREYLETRGAGNLIKQVLDVAYTIEYGLEIERQSAINLLLFIHADRSSKWRPFGVFSDERFHVREGNQAIPVGLANRIGNPVRLGHRLVAVRKNAAGRVTLTFDTAGGTVEQTFDAVVFAMPFSVLRDVDLDASLALPTEKRLAIDTLEYGTNAKMMVAFQGPHWRALGGNGDSYSLLPNHQNTWETNPSNATPTMAVLTDYSGGQRGEGLNPNATQQEARRFLEDLDIIYPGALDAAVRTQPGNRFVVHLEHWPSNPLTKGSYTCNHPGYFTTIADNEKKPVDNLFFAGEHTNSFYEWQGFMEGAALSGLRAADDVIRYLRG